MKAMDLNKEKPAEVKGLGWGEDHLFAAIALAAIRVHDSDSAKEKGLTLKEICAMDHRMRAAEDRLVLRLFRAFGRNCIPVLTKYLEEAGMTEDKIEDALVPFVNYFNEKLGLN